ncbi:MAG TPA: PKD domain-containing protein, partial [Terriglobia bacterium]|nr:PKD domain-containing protein [Terriglobia bacterium]
GGHYEAYDALHADAPVAIAGGSLTLAQQPPHSVRLIEIVDTSVPAAAPSITLKAPVTAATGDALKLQAVVAANSVPALSYHWDFGDGTTASGRVVTHAFTRAADYNVKLTVDGMDGLPAEKGMTVAVHGAMKTAFHLLENRRYVGPDGK